MRASFFLGISSLLLLGTVVACPKNNTEPARATPADRANDADAGTVLPHAHIDVEGTDGRSFGLDVELAITQPTRERGLMFRRSLDDASGMLFIFNEPEHHTFWMKNTLIPLDMIFATADGTVLGVVAQAEPQTLDPREVEGDSKYVLEVAGGWCAQHGIGKGAKLILGETARTRVE
jgi:uncharacterized membrane protein (UPF0127 family)